MATGSGGTAFAQADLFVNDGGFGFPELSATITASPASISFGDFAELMLDAPSGVQCYLNDGFGSWFVPCTGTIPVFPNLTTTYTFIATDYVEEVRASTTVTVIGSAEPPVVTIAAFPTEIVRGASSTISWSAPDAWYCYINGFGEVPTSGSMVVSPTQEASYTIIAVNLGGEAAATTTVRIISPPPTASLIASPDNVIRGAASLLTWSTTNAVACTIDNGVGAIPCQGTKTLTPTATAIYTLSATGPSGTTTTQVMVTVSLPIANVSILVSPSTIHLGETATLSWNATGVTGVLLNQGIGLVQTVGMKVVQPTSTTE